MSETGKDRLTFDIQETVFIDKDKAGMEALKEVELVPEIEVMEEDSAVTIAGCLHLNGQYEAYQEASEADEPDEESTLSESMHFRPFEAEESAFSAWHRPLDLHYRIPVNISIPRDRIENLDDIFAVVDSFDYDIQTPRQLSVKAHLILSGIAADSNANVENTKFGNDELLEFVHAAGDEYPRPDSSEADRKRSDEKQDDVEEGKAEDERLQHEEGPMSVESKEGDDSEDEENEKSESVGQADEEVTPLSDGEENEPEEENVDDEDDEPSVKVSISRKEEYPDEDETLSLQQPMADGVKEHSEDGEDTDGTEFERAAEVGTEEDDIHDETTHDTSENATYLTHLMEREEESFTRLKMCIVQKDESIDEIADRYEVDVEALLSTNKMENGNLDPGQIIWIPRV